MMGIPIPGGLNWLSISCKWGKSMVGDALRGVNRCTHSSCTSSLLPSILTLPVFSFAVFSFGVFSFVVLSLAVLLDVFSFGVDVREEL